MQRRTSIPAAGLGSVCLIACFAVACGNGAGTPASAPAGTATAPASSAERPIRRPSPQVETTSDLGGVSARGGVARLTVRVTLPPDLHVQANKPRDPALIPTELTVAAPAGFTVVDITYPEPVDFNQAGAAQPLAVYPNVFDIVVRLKVPPGVAGGTPVAGSLRYQACNDVLCFAPANVEASWLLTIPGA